jgi:hypothetical protein
MTDYSFQVGATLQADWYARSDTKTGKVLVETAEGRFQPQQGSGWTEYTGRLRCQANNDTCNARPIRGTKYCAGHTRHNQKIEAAGGVSE